CP
ncbi:hypothetical protein D044_1862B, partial [Vibrio parahaemolyticus EKP-026]